MSELVEIEIITTVSTSRYGNMSTGDMLRTDKAYAEHLVELGAAKYAKAPVAQTHAQRIEAPPPVAEEHPEPARRTLFKKRK